MISAPRSARCVVMAPGPSIELSMIRTPASGAVESAMVFQSVGERADLTVRQISHARNGRTTSAELAERLVRVGRHLQPGETEGLADVAHRPTDRPRVADGVLEPGERRATEHPASDVSVGIGPSGRAHVQLGAEHALAEAAGWDVVVRDPCGEPGVGQHLLVADEAGSVDLESSREGVAEPEPVEHVDPIADRVAADADA